MRPTLCAAALVAAMTWLPQTARSDELNTVSNGNLPVATAVYRPSEQGATLQNVDWRYGYGYSPRYYGYGYRYPSYSYGYRYPSYSYRYPSYGYRSYYYPRYGYGYGYPRYDYGYRYGYRPGISFGFRF